MKLKENPNPPQVTFRRIHGRIVPIVKGKRAPGATKILKQELDDRASEIAHAEAGYRGVGYHEGHAVKNFGTKSSFPSWYSDIGFKSKKDFVKTIKEKKGVKYERLVNDSISGLLHGRNSSFGYVPPSTSFRIATRQTFDNTHVVFRNIDGRVVPMRIKREEIPF